VDFLDLKIPTRGEGSRGRGRTHEDTRLPLRVAIFDDGCNGKTIAAMPM
jgi:hypothetical protein